MKIIDPAASAEQCAFRRIIINCFFIEMCISVVVTLLFFASSFSRRADVHGLQNTSSIFSEAGGNTCSVVNSYCISSLSTQTTNGIAVPFMFLSPLVKDQSPSLAVPPAVLGTPAPLARCHNSDSAETQVGKHQMSFPNYFTTKYIHLVAVLQSDQF